MVRRPPLGPFCFFASVLWDLLASGARSCLTSAAPRNLIVPVCYVILQIEEVNQAIFISVMLDIFNCLTVTYLYASRRKVRPSDPRRAPPRRVPHRGCAP